ncbi:MAG: cytochrome d ubiquinol oxidase subunit II [Planktotalea sp.]|jgi:cytochrome d ubiquinol oxidase subunit II|uniref:cytochrome d ubiquinol oxidase subunit II n=1 Tax=Planktotalea sp. TaxID=2029877 RepID=UPI00262EC58D|nr:cytochrome d ubiquinol oxidase subunit II [Planktotalea sp.]MDG1084669.1 cytochrome d ubiquinol oxidase subunit II [Planktotalea sp.]
MWGLVFGIVSFSLATPFVSTRIFNKWFSLPEILYLSPMPTISLASVIFLWLQSRCLPYYADKWSWTPFAATTALFALAYGGMAYSFYTYAVPEKLTIFEAASVPESLFINLLGTLFALPAILEYTFLSYYIFRGKAAELLYD